MARVDRVPGSFPHKQIYESFSTRRTGEASRENGQGRGARGWFQGSFRGVGSPDAPVAPEPSHGVATTASWGFSRANFRNSHRDSAVAVPGCVVEFALLKCRAMLIELLCSVSFSCRRDLLMFVMTWNFVLGKKYIMLRFVSRVFWVMWC